MLEETENPDIQVRIEDLDNGFHSIIKGIHPNELCRTLGYNLNTMNDNTEMTKDLVAKSRKYNNALFKSRLTAKQKRMTIATFITPALAFPSRGGTLKYEELASIQKPLGMSTCPLHNVQGNFSLTCLVGPTLLGGLEDPLFAVKKNGHGYTMLMDHLERNDATRKCMWLSMGHTQMAIGSGTAIFKLRYKEHEHLTPDTWIKKLWKFTATCNATNKIK